MNVLSILGSNESKIRKVLNVSIPIMFFGFLCLTIVNPTFADTDYVEVIMGVLDSMINIIGIIFVAVGVILSVYSVGQLVLAFKNEDADSKTRASTMLVVGVVLIALPAIIASLNLTQYIENAFNG